MCAYRVALHRDKGAIVVSYEERERVRELVLRNGGAATSSSLDNLRMSSSVNFALAGTPPSWYSMDARTNRVAVADLDQRKKEIEKLFEEGV